MKTDLRHFLEAQDFYRIPLQKLATGHYKCEVFVNKVPGVFIIDTGASSSCIGAAQAKKFNLQQEESEIKAAGAGAINMHTQLARSNQLRIGDKSIRNVEVVIFDLTHVNQALAQAEEGNVDGILGADLLKKHRAVIDYGRNVLYLK